MNKKEQYYKHKYGGIYCLLMDAINKSNNDEIMVVYKHIYPFDEKIYVRNKGEFFDNNVLISKEQFNSELAKPREEFQKEIMAKKINK